MRYTYLLLLGLVQTACAIQPAVNVEQPEVTHAEPDTAVYQVVYDEPVAPPKKDDVWERLRSQFSLPDSDHPRVQRELAWFARHPAYMQRVVERARPYMHFIAEQVEAAGIPTEIALLPIVESAFQPFAYSHGRAAGIWQFIPSTGRRYGLKQNWWYDGRRDVHASTIAAVRFLKILHREMHGDWMLALAAYNTGGGKVNREIRRNKRRGKPTDFFSLNLPRETRAYVPKLLALKKIVANPEQYGINMDEIPNEPYFEKVELDSQIDLALAADLAGLPLEDLYKLNPGFNRWATAPAGPHDLLLPLENADIFRENLAEYPPEKRIKWIRHRIRQGETISTIARKYHVSINTIKRVNRMRSNRLRAGHGLTIPVASRKLGEYKLSATQRKSKLQNIPRKGTRVDYIVQQGDTFWELARHHRVGVRQLAKWNGMAPRDPLVPGQKLVIWSRRAEAVSYNTADPISAPPRRNVTKRIGYRVRRGDSLSRIADKFNITVSQLKRWNKSRLKSSLIRPGQYLTLYVDVTRQSS